ncbi:hypothetical protein [Paractinoplanes ferrugineus]|nr:hypothetical protein [Actinoplanes ferrugineus]
MPEAYAAQRLFSSIAALCLWPGDREFVAGAVRPPRPPPDCRLKAGLNA